MSGAVKALKYERNPIKSTFHPGKPVGDALGIPDPIYDYAHPAKVEDPVLPGVPTIDDARQQQQVSDRILRRRGVLANIFSGANSATPSVGKATLGGA